MRIQVVPHDPAWRGRFGEESERIADALGEIVIAVHHIGSTSIPGIFAKPVIDILVEVANVDKVDERASAMNALRYEAMGEFGIPGRRYFRKDNEYGIRTHQVHVFEAGSDQATRHVGFRDYLIAHPEEAWAYSDLKRELAAVHPNDPEAYMDGKDAFIKQIDRRASKWRRSIC